MGGKVLRLAKLIPDTQKGVCMLPIDHGVTYGPMEGIEDHCALLSQVMDAGIDSAIMHKGALTKLYKYPELRNGNYIVHLSGSTAFHSQKSFKVLVGTVEEAIQLGATGISLHMSLGIDREPEMLEDFGRVSTMCHKWGMPLLAMIYLENPEKKPEEIAHAARVAQELGADIVKVDYPQTIEGMRQVVESVHIPVVIAGGTKMQNDFQFLSIIDNAMQAGAKGVSIGRNIFQHKNPRFITSVVSELVKGNASLEDSLEKLGVEGLYETDKI